MKKAMDSGMKPKGEMSGVKRVADVGDSQEGHGGTDNYNGAASGKEIDQKQVPRTGCYNSERDGH